MRIKDVAMGGVLIALFMAVSISTGAASRSLQTIIDVFRILVVAFYIRNKSIKDIIIFATAMFILSLFLLPTTIALTNVVSSIFLGVLIGKLIRIKKILFAIFLSYLGNIVAFIYSVYLYWVITGINIIGIYKGQYIKLFEVGSVVADKELASNLLKSIDLFVIVVLGLDLFFSAIFSLLFVKVVLKRLDRVDNHIE